MYDYNIRKLEDICDSRRQQWFTYSLLPINRDSQFLKKEFLLPCFQQNVYFTFKPIQRVIRCIFIIYFKLQCVLGKYDAMCYELQ